MKKYIKTLLYGISLLLLSQLSVLGETNFGAAGAGRDSALDLPKMLTYAIQDEYLAQAEYQFIIRSFGEVRPFTNIIKAEKTHIDMLKPLFKTYGVMVPADTAMDHIIKTNSIKTSLAAGVQAEIDNINMYELFLKQSLPADVQDVFKRLLNASQNHLKAFQKALSRY